MVAVLAGCAESHVHETDGAADARTLDDGGARDADADARAEPRDGGAPELPFPVEPSGETLCVPGAGETTAVAAWADGRGLFVLVARPDGVPVLLGRDTAGWTTWTESVPGAEHLTGVPDGPLFVWPGACSLLRIDGPGRAAYCFEVPSEVPDRAVRTTAARFAGADHGWVIGEHEAGFVYAHHWRDGAVVARAFWSMAEPVGVWGDALGVFAASADGVYAASGSRSGQRSDVPSGRYVGMWGVDRNEVGVATADGRLLVLGASGWRTTASGLGDVSFVTGDGDAVAVAGPRAIARWADGTATALLEWADPKLHVEAIASHGSTVYAVLSWQAAEGDPCGSLLAVQLEPSRSARRL